MPTPQSSGLLADRPAPTAETRNRVYWATDGGAATNGALYLSNGAAWATLFDLSAADAPLAGSVVDASVSSSAAIVRSKLNLTENVNTVANAGAAQTIPEPNVQSISRMTLTAACTLTFPTAAAGKTFRLVLVQGGSGSYTITWPGSVKWAGGTAPTLSTSVGKIDYFQFVCTDGTNWAGFTSGLDMR